jgi:putative nucleotide binding protein
MSDSRSDDRSDAEGEPAVVLDYLPHGRADDDRPQYERPALAHVLGIEDFRLAEAVLAEDADISIGDRVPLSAGTAAGIEELRDIEYDELSGGATSELEYAIDDIIDADTQRFVDFYNDAQPITLRLHQLNLLPGIGKKLRNAILDERERQPFDSFEDLQSRVSGLHNPREVLVERIVEELRADDLKYRTFVRRDEQ